jgi:hypothetical protein
LAEALKGFGVPRKFTIEHGLQQLPTAGPLHVFAHSLRDDLALGATLMLGSAGEGDGVLG